MAFLHTDMNFIILFLSCFGLGWAAYRLAQIRGRDPIVWFFLGMLFGLLGILVLYCLPKPKEKEKVQADLPPIEKPSIVPLVIDAPKEWFFVDKSKTRHGPVDFSILKSKWTNQTIDPFTYVWSEGMQTWKKIEELPDILGQLTKA